MLTDLRELNEVLERDEWPLETIDQTLYSMSRFNCISTLDQIMGYYAMQVEEEDKECLGIITPHQIYVYDALPQGAKILADIFQREIMCLNEGLNYVKVFINDTAVVERGTFDEHLTELDEVLQRMEDAGS